MGTNATMYSSKFPMKNENIELNFSYHISPDVTIECLRQKTHESLSEDEDSEYFNPLTLCAITMDEDIDPVPEPNPQKSVELVSKIVKLTKSNENSSFVCNSTDTGASKKKRFSCHICQKTFGWTTDLKRHILIHTGERPFKCTLCFATFTRNFLLQKHKTKTHQCLSPNEISQLNNNVAKNLMEIKLKMRELQQSKSDEEPVLETDNKAKKKKNPVNL